MDAIVIRTVAQKRSGGNGNADEVWMEKQQRPWWFWNIILFYRAKNARDGDDDDPVNNDQQVDAIVFKDSSQKVFWWEWEC